MAGSAAPPTATRWSWCAAACGPTGSGPSSTGSRFRPHTPSRSASPRSTSSETLRRVGCTAAALECDANTCPGACSSASLRAALGEVRQVERDAGVGHLREQAPTGRRDAGAAVLGGAVGEVVRAVPGEADRAHAEAREQPRQLGLATERLGALEGEDAGDGARVERGVELAGASVTMASAPSDSSASRCAASIRRSACRSARSVACCVGQYTASNCTRTPAAARAGRWRRRKTSRSPATRRSATSISRSEWRSTITGGRREGRPGRRSRGRTRKVKIRIATRVVKTTSRIEPIAISTCANAKTHDTCRNVYDGMRGVTKKWKATAATATASRISFETSNAQSSASRSARPPARRSR